MNQSNNTRSLTTYNTTIFLVGQIIIGLCNVNSIKYVLCSGPPVYISIGKSFLVIFTLYFFSKNIIAICHIQAHLSGNYIPVVILSPNYTSLPFTVATFLTTCLMVVLQPSGYSVFHSGDSPIQLGLLWQSYSCQYLNTETSTQGNRGFTTETLSISYTICLYIRLVVTL